MPLPPIPFIAGGTGVAAGYALNAWLQDPPEAWENRDTFNARMRDMRTLALALNDGFSTCKPFMSNKAQLQSWRGARDNFGKFYGDVGTLVYTDPNAGEIAQAKSYASKFYFWTGEYNRLKCGGGAPLDPLTPVDPFNPTPGPAPEQAQDWGAIIKWSAIGVGGIIALKTLTDVFRKGR